MAKVNRAPLKRKGKLQKPTTEKAKVTPLFPGIPKKKRVPPPTVLERSRQRLVSKIRDFARGTSVMAEVEVVIIEHEAEVVVSKTIKWNRG